MLIKTKTFSVRNIGQARGWVKYVADFIVLKKIRIIGLIAATCASTPSEWEYRVHLGSDVLKSKDVQFDDVLFVGTLGRSSTSMSVVLFPKDFEMTIENTIIYIDVFFSDRSGGGTLLLYYVEE